MNDELSGPLAPPLANGEAVFEAPWQGRVFGMAHVLVDAGRFTWDEFRASLIEEIAGADPAAQGEYAYYDHFHRALERLLVGRGMVPAGGLDARSAELDARPHGHDHDHDHEHEHDHEHDHDREQGF